MPLPTRRPSRSRALTASAYRVGDRDSDYMRRKNLPWQQRALEVTTLVPELNFASRFYSRMLRQIRIFPASRNEQNQTEEIKSGVPVDVLNRVQDPGGGRSQMLTAYGRLMCITGEGILFGRDLESERERWTFVWNQEITVESDSQGNPRKIIHHLSGSEQREYSPEQAVMYRMWTPSPTRSYEAESPMQAGLEIAEELITLTKAVQATAVTRLTNGLLFMPQEISPPPVEPVGAEDPLSDPWANDYIEHISTQIQNPGTAEAASPLISWVPGDYIEKIRWIQVHDPQTDYLESALRKESITRLAYGMDMPPEALTGLGNTNHWAAMQILGDMWKSHGAPVAQQFCDELSAAYLQPALREADFPDWEAVFVDYDASRVVVKPDRSEDADTAAKLGFVGGRGYRLMKNIPEEWAPTDNERKEILEVLGRGTQPRREQRSPNGDGSDPALNGPPPPGPEGDSGRKTRVVASAAFAHEAMGAAMMAVARCRELAGVRLWQKQKSCPDCFEKANGMPHALVASALGPAVVNQVGWDPQRLVRGGSDTLRDMLVYWDYSPKQADAICEMIESFAAHTLFDERLPQLPAGFAAHLERAKEMENAVARF